MGYFEEILAKSKEEVSIEKLKADLKRFYIIRRDAYLELEGSSNYLSALQAKREEIVNSVKDFLEPIGYEIELLDSLQMQGLGGIVARSGNESFDLRFSDEKYFVFNHPGHYSFPFSLIDITEEPWLELGSEHNGEVILLGHYSGGNYEVLNQAVKDMEKEINNLREKLSNGYSPTVRIQNKEDFIFEDFREFLAEFDKSADE